MNQNTVNVLFQHTHTRTASESGVWSQYEAMITTYFSKAIYADYGAKEERDRNKMSLSLFF